MEKTYPVLLDPHPYTQKPQGAQISQISQRIQSHPAMVTPESLAEALGNGQTVVLAEIKGERRKENFVRQQVVALDFDNTTPQKTKATGNDYYTVEQLLSDPWVLENAAFVYSTFSWQDDWQRFRVVFFLDRPLENNQQVTKLYEWLMAKFPTADRAAKDSTRLFFGGKETVMIDPNNLLKTSQVTFKKETSPERAVVPSKKPKHLTHAEAKEMFHRYLEKESEALMQYENALSALWVIARGALTGEISYIDAYQFAHDLAMDNHEWERENKKKLEEAFQTPLQDFHTHYSFSEKFGYKFQSEEGTLSPSDMIETSKFLVDKLEIKLFNHQLYFKTGNHWIHDDNKLLRAVDQYVELKKAQDTELIAQFMKRAELIEQDIFNIQFRNNYYLHGDEIKEGTVDGFTPYYMDVIYDPNAYSADVDKFFNFLSCNRLDLRRVTEEMFGHILMVKGFPHKVFFFVGEKGANGKSTLLEMVNHWVGDFGANISLENFSDPTSVVELEGKLVNVGDDIDASYLETSSNFKILASGNTITVRPIYSTPYKMRNKATLIFTTNEMPTFKDKTGGITRRLVLIPCDNVVTDPDFNLDEKLATDEAKSYLLNLALQGLKWIVQNGNRLSESETINELVGDYLKNTNSVLMFVEEEGINEMISEADNYDAYKEYCRQMGLIPFKKKGFTLQLLNLGYEQDRRVILGKRLRIYKKKQMDMF
ncbi:MAG: phage/plasmid primase, P4 family [Aerococcus sp.]|nr:phage/plasmid primase, P4 family [Aerococcus sp.]